MTKSEFDSKFYQLSDEIKKEFAVQFKENASKTNATLSGAELSAYLITTSMDFTEMYVKKMLESFLELE